jgi:hypothetical protein
MDKKFKRKNIGLKFQEINYKFVIQPNLKGAGFILPQIMCNLLLNVIN